MKLYKTTIVVLTDYSPDHLPADDLVREAMNGDAFPYEKYTEEVESTDMGEHVQDFFGTCDSEEAACTNSTL